jgi:hypothetical protein
MLKPRFDPLRFSRDSYPTQDVRHRMIEDVAYLRAQQRGFAAGKELEDWLAAEAEVDFQLSCRYLRNYG